MHLSDARTVSDSGNQASDMVQGSGNPKGLVQKPNVDLSGQIPEHCQASHKGCPYVGSQECAKGQQVYKPKSFA